MERPFTPRSLRQPGLACLGVLVSYLPVVGVSVSLPVIQQALNASTTELQWIATLFILPTAALLLTFGVLGDIFGRKKVFLAGLTLVVVGCLVCLTANGVVQLCVGQALTGFGTAALMPSTLALLTHVSTDRKQRIQAIALWTASLGLGLTLGPLINGLILDHASSPSTASPSSSARWSDASWSAPPPASSWSSASSQAASAPSSSPPSTRPPVSPPPPRSSAYSA